jgi:hypothetical protein
LADNGGLTSTHALMPNSPALDRGANPLNLTTDQRGAARQSGPGVDMGAFEFAQTSVGSGSSGVAPPPPPPPRAGGATVGGLVPQGKGGTSGNKKWVVRVTFANGRTVEFVSPFQKDRFKKILAVLLDLNHDGEPDALRFTAQRIGLAVGKKEVSRTILL